MDLYDIYTNKDRTYNLINPNIIFYPYSKEDTQKIIDKQKEARDFIEFIHNETLQTRLNLSQSELHKDPIFMKFCVSNMPNLLGYASDEIRDDINIILMGENNGSGGQMFRYISDRLKNDKDFIINTLPVLEFASDEIKDNDEIIMFALMDHPRNTQYASNRLKNDKTFMMKYLDNEKKSHKNTLRSYYFEIINHISDNLKNDTEFIICFLELERIRLKDKKYIYENAICYIGNEIRKNKEIILLFTELEEIYYKNNDNRVRNQNHIIRGIFLNMDESLLFGHDIMIKSLELDLFNFDLIDCDTKFDRETVIKLLNSKYSSDISSCDSGILSTVDEYSNDREIVEKAIIKNGYNYFFASDRLKDDTDIIVKAIKYCYNDRDHYQNTDDIEEDHLDKIKTLINNILSYSKYETIRAYGIPKKIIKPYYDKILLNIHRKNNNTQIS